ncbi:MAG: lycopene cyclase family protein [Nonlabens sp.]
MDSHFDIAIIGLGCAGSHLVHAFLEHDLNLKTVVIDPWTLEKAEKAWSFWEEGPGKWEHLIEQTWSRTKIATRKKSMILDLEPYTYKSMDSKKFTAFAEARLQQSQLFTFIDSSVEKVQPKDGKEWIQLSNGSHITADRVLDSRVPSEFFQDKSAITLKQHFKGIVIETKNEVFDPETCTMMDYSIMDDGTCSFTYVLPYSKTKALVEFTYFSHEEVYEETYDHFIDKYLREELKINDYNLISTESGIVPMTTYDFTEHNTLTHLRVGTGGGWVKPSTGYSFKMCEKKSQQVALNIKTGRLLEHQLFSKKARLYDTTLLDVLDKNNGDGDKIFFKLYSSNKMKYFFRFLDEETSFLQDVRIMLPMTSPAFLKPFFKNLPQVFRS